MSHKQHCAFDIRLPVSAQFQQRKYGPERVTLMLKERLNGASVAKLSLKLAQKQQRQSRLKKQELSLSFSWQRDLVEFSIR